MYASENNNTSFVLHPYWQYGFLGGVLALITAGLFVISLFGFIQGRSIPSVLCILMCIVFAFCIYYFALRLAMINVTISTEGMEIKRGKAIICPYRSWDSLSGVYLIAITQENSAYTNTGSGRYFVASDTMFSENECRILSKTLKGQIPEGKHGNQFVVLLDGDMVRRIKQLVGNSIRIYEYSFVFKESE